MSDHQKLASAESQGLLSPIREYLERHVGELSKPMGPEDMGIDGVVDRISRDGGVGALSKCYAWLNSRTKNSPDEAQNTEE